MKRTMLAATVGLFALLAPAGSAQAPTATTLSFYEPANGGTFKIIDNAPKSPSSNPESRKFRFSVGDEVIFGNRLLNQKGGTRVGDVYARFTVVKGKTFRSVVIAGDGVIVLTNGDQISLYGVFNFSNPDVRISVTGGTGAYAGARGTFASHNNTDDSSQDTLTLIP